MTAVAAGPDWAAMRREYAGGDAGLTLVELAERHDVPPGTVHARAARELWRDDSRRPIARNVVSRRLGQLLVELADPKPARVLARLAREVGEDNPYLPTLAEIRDRMPRPSRHHRRTKMEIEVPVINVDGLRRHCWGCGQITSANPCAHCGDEI